MFMFISTDWCAGSRFIAFFFFWYWFIFQKAFLLMFVSLFWFSIFYNTVLLHSMLSVLGINTPKQMKLQYTNNKYLIMCRLLQIIFKGILFGLIYELIIITKPVRHSNSQSQWWGEWPFPFWGCANMLNPDEAGARAGLLFTNYLVSLGHL